MLCGVRSLRLLQPFESFWFLAEQVICQGCLVAESGHVGSEFFIRQYFVQIGQGFGFGCRVQGFYLHFDNLPAWILGKSAGEIALLLKDVVGLIIFAYSLVNPAFYLKRRHEGRAHRQRFIAFRYRLVELAVIEKGNSGRALDHQRPRVETLGDLGLAYRFQGTVHAGQGQCKPVMRLRVRWIELNGAPEFQFGPGPLALMIEFDIAERGVGLGQIVVYGQRL